jgi:phospholipid/cholesterol/gamma-HCH transport system substrate-binding protein
MADLRRMLGNVSSAANNLDRNPTRLPFGPAISSTPQASVPAPATERRRP